MGRYRFGDPYAYRKRLYWNGFQFIVAWHFAAYLGYKYFKGKLPDDVKAKWDSMNTAQKLLAFRREKDEDDKLTVAVINPTKFTVEDMTAKEFVKKTYSEKKEIPPSTG